MSTAVLFSFAFVVLVAGGSLLWLSLELGRKQDRALTERVNKAVGVEPVAPHKRLLPTRVVSLVERASSWLRLPFVFGLRNIWAIKLPTWQAALFALGGALATWLFMRELLHLALWSSTIGTVAMGLFLPRLIMLRQQRRADQRFIEYFPDAIDMIVRMVRSGLSVAVAIRTVGQEAVAPVGDVFKRVADRGDIGVPLEEALADVAEELGLNDFRFFTTTIGLQRMTGGNLARTLETLSEIMRKRRAVRLKAIAATAEVRTSAFILGAIPFVIVGALTFVNPAYLQPMITDPRGNVLIGSAALCLILGGLSMRWIIRSGMRT